MPLGSQDYWWLSCTLTLERGKAEILSNLFFVLEGDLITEFVVGSLAQHPPIVVYMIGI